MPSNNIKLFDENKSNMIADVDYNTNIQRLNGVQSGVASSQLQNKTLYQTSLIAYAIAQFMNEMGFDASDENAVSTFVNNLSSSIKKPSDSAVRYINQSLTTAQQAQARSNINAAPDGYGYGGALDTVSGATDEEFLAAVEAKLAAMPYMGAMQINWGSYPALDGLARVGTLAKHSGGQYASLTGYSYGGTAITRCKNAGTWGPWEWANPPLALGVEYRTTERYLGKPVYCQAVDFGELPNAATKGLYVSTMTNVDQTIRWAGITSNGYVLPGGDLYTGWDDIIVRINGRRIDVKTTTNESAYTAKFVLWYTRTTD